MINKFSSINQIIEFVNKYETKSIFHENHRIMTADQVVNHKKGDEKSKCLLLCTIINLKYNIECAILLTTEGCYSIWMQEDAWNIWDSKSGICELKFYGKVLLAFDSKFSYYPLMRNEHIEKEKPAWLEFLYKFELF